MGSHLALLLLSLLHPVLLKATAAQGGGGCYIDAIYCLGDSIADTGNLVHLALPGTPIPSAYFPYGESVRRPSGRFSDGLLMIDYFSAAFGLPNYIPPYLDKSANFDHGVNFAVAGATALDQSFFLEKRINMTYSTNSLDVQLQWFNDHLKTSVCPSREDCPKKLERAVFFVGEIGGNDYNYALMQGRSIDEVKTFVPQVVSKVVDAAKQVIDVGAVQLVVPSNFPIGCLPSYLAVLGRRDSNYDERNCLKNLNNFAEFHNQHLQKALQNLKKDNPNVNIVYADYYNTFLNILDRADDYGFDKSSLLKACCGVGDNYNFDLNSMCGSPGVPVCPDPTEFISWDGIHSTQQAHKNIAIQLLSNVDALKKWRC